MSEQSTHDNVFFKKLGEILNAPLPGTEKPVQDSHSAEPPADDDSLIDYIKDILNRPLPVEVSDSTEGLPEVVTTPTEVGSEQSPLSSTPETSSEEMGENWWERDWEAFQQHQD